MRKSLKVKKNCFSNVVCDIDIINEQMEIVINGETIYIGDIGLIKFLSEAFENGIIYIDENKFNVEESYFILKAIGVTIKLSSSHISIFDIGEYSLLDYKRESCLSILDKKCWIVYGEDELWILDICHLKINTLHLYLICVAMITNNRSIRSFLCNMINKDLLDGKEIERFVEKVIYIDEQTIHDYNNVRDEFDVAAKLDQADNLYS